MEKSDRHQSSHMIEAGITCAHDVPRWDKHGIIYGVLLPRMYTLSLVIGKQQIEPLYKVKGLSRTWKTRKDQWTVYPQ
jgi:hypothetical protein